MKKFISILLSLALVFSLAALTGCSSKKDDAAPSDAGTAEDKTIVVGASATPHAEILEQVKSALADEGYTLEIKIFDDYVLPNTALADGELDANYFQHLPYLNSFNASNNTDLVSVAAIH